ncbi:MAG: ABC transporter ATP-binding protein [Chloroflexota bacterium]|nr:ABC transporter ATP-binding protein [Chloroflexota bacterium]
MIQLQDIVKVYLLGKRQLEVLRGINLSIEKGEMVAIMGASGSGKTTLLNIIGCLDKPTSGTYYLDGKEVSRLSNRELAGIRGQKIGFIFQTFNLLSYMSALANVELGQRYADKRNSHRAFEALEKVGLADRIHHRPSELSGGEQQRVAIARAISKDPALILADEPTGNLDSHSGEELMGILSGLHKERGLTLLMVTHDPKIARYCQRTIYVKDGLIVNEDAI